MRTPNPRIAFVMLFVIALTLSAPTASYAKQEPSPPPNTSIAVTVNGIGCSTSAGTGAFNVLAFSFGATQSATTGTGGGGGAGKASIQDLHVTKAFNECSPALFGGVVTGKHFPSARLVHSDANGNPVLIIDLSNLLISSYQISGSAGPDFPTESVSFAFEKICLTEAGNNTKLCYDAALNRVS